MSITVQTPSTSTRVASRRSIFTMGPSHKLLIRELPTQFPNNKET